MNIKNFIKNITEELYSRFFRYRIVVRCVAAILIALAVLLVYKIDAFERLELLTVDYRFLLRHTGGIDKNIVFIDMAEDSIEAIGRWPWPRKWHAVLTKALSEYGARIVAFDVIFSEPQDELDDRAFEESLKNSKIVYLPLSYDLNPKKGNKVYDGQGVSSIFTPIPEFKRWAAGTGHISAVQDPDGILRRVYPIIGFKNKQSYQLGFDIGCKLLGITEKDRIFLPNKHTIVLNRSGQKSIRIPLDDDNQMIINWHNQWGKESNHYSYIDIIKSYALMKEGKKPLVDLTIFKDKVCIVGLTALGLIDIKPVPIENAYPAVGVNAMVANSILHNDFVAVTHTFFNTVLVFLIALLFTFYLSELRPLAGMATAAISMIGYFLLSLGVFIFFRILVVTFYPIFAIFIAYSVTAAYTQLLQSVERARLFKQATRDGLTQLYNVRHFNLLIEAELRNANLDKNKRFSIVMFDIDNFKKLNDTHGHQAGDLILREFAKIVQSRCRQTDIVARYGGEEFIIMLTGAGSKEAADVAEKIREAIAAKTFKFGEVVYSTSVSIGVTQHAGEKTREEIVEKADKALYNAKHTGKNRVVVYSKEVEAATPPPPEKH